MKIKRVVLSVLSCFALLASSLPSTTVFVSADDEVDASTPQLVTVAPKSGTKNLSAVFANGTDITVTYDESSQTNTVTYDGGEIKNVPTNANVFAGSHASDVEIEEVSITIDGAKLNSVYGGGLHKSTVKNVEITVENDAVINFVCGGGANALINDNCNGYGSGESDPTNSPTKVENATITIESGTIGSVFGGGQGYCCTNATNVTIQGGDIGDLVAGGSNGYTGSANVTIEGGDIDLVISVCRGSMDSADIAVNGGTVKDLYIGADDDTSDNGTIESVNVTIGPDATVENFAAGTSGNETIDVNEGDYSFSVDPEADVTFDETLEEVKDTNNSYYYFKAYTSDGEDATNEAATKLTNIPQVVNSKGKTYQYTSVMANGETVVATDVNDDEGNWKETKITCSDGSYVLTNYDAINLFGGSHNSDVKTAQTNVTVDGTTHVRTVWGGGWHKSQVETANVTVKGNAQIYGIQGGASAFFASASCGDEQCSGWNKSTGKNKQCFTPNNGGNSETYYNVDGNARVDTAIVNIESCAGTYTAPDGTAITTTVYGGGESVAYTGSVYLNISGGKLEDVGAAGSNGYTGSATVKVSGDANINNLTSAVRGEVNGVDITIEGGTVNTLYVGAYNETDNPNPATIESANVTVSGGTVKNVKFGGNGTTPIDPDKDTDYTVKANGGTIENINGADYNASGVECNHAAYTMTLTEAVEATCVIPGAYAYWECSNCGHFFADKNANGTYDADTDDDVTGDDGDVDADAIAIPAGDAYHDYQPVEGTTETCTIDGVKAHYECSTCGQLATSEDGQEFTKVEEEDIIIKAPGHTLEEDAAIEATCTTTGLTKGYHCSVCGAIITPQYAIPTIPHTPGDKVAAKAPTCTEKGLTEGTKCAVCGQIYEGQEEVEALGHEFLDANYKTTENDKAATCIENATKTAKCTRCDVTDTKEVPNSALGHDFDELIAEVEATCTEAGTKAHYECSRCDVLAVDETIGEDEEEQETVKKEVTADELVIPATGHTPKAIPAVDATCTSLGLTEGSECEVCGIVLVPQTIVPMIPHTIETVPAVEPTCDAWGLTEGAKCSVCGTILTPQNPVLPLGHDYDENGVCTRDGAKDPNYVEPTEPTEPTSEPTSGTTQPTTVLPTTTQPTTAVKPATDTVSLKAIKVTQAKIKKLKVKSKAKKTINVSWKKVSGAKGYQIEVSKSSSFTAKAKVLKKNVKKVKVKLKNKKIKSGKTYYVRVRAYATYKDAKGKTQKAYSNWNYVIRKVKVK